jgi:hypothetical protein
VECEAYSSGVSGKQKKDNPLRSLRLCGELLPFFQNRLSELKPENGLIILVFFKISKSLVKTDIEEPG